ncbi:protease complex subunit PrcB family protein [Heliorestis convoluta]|uniref:Protease complex subunit PrcB family protein, putative n=1 Tax=Heliorestis convoluta TaxID=356322 RepID=A0A5Q2N2D4_9FIRM|nr:protease complex subunit PrcB family protein [Heliorestis convoluta]QGG48023.1 protease complex subunit PrcB family protein, putative [Heliorestis convoluta]
MNKKIFVVFTVVAFLLLLFGTGCEGQKADAVVEEPVASDVTAHVEEDQVTVSWGEKPTGGYSISIVDVTCQAGTLTVSYELTSPKPGDFVTEAITYPEDSAPLPDDCTDFTEIVLVNVSK